MSSVDRIRIAMIGHNDARSIRTWSGTALFCKSALERHVGSVIDLTPAPFSLLPWRAAWGVTSRLLRRSYPYGHDPLFARRLGAAYTRLLARGNYDLVFGAAASASFAWLDTPLPTVGYSDATWRAVENYYAVYSDLPRRLVMGAEEIEQRYLDRTRVALFCSDWARESAIRDYGVPGERAHTVYIGANLPRPPERSHVLPRPVVSGVHLLMVGVNWETKGGPTALDTLRTLLDRGVDARLTVVGCSAPEGVAHERMTVVPFLDKSVPEQRDLFESLWSHASFLILPTRFEAAGIVFCEASAHALPSLAPATGGVTSLIRDGVNGVLLPEGAGGEIYADRIMALLADPDRYAQLCESSRKDYEERLNWDSWGRNVAALLRRHLPDLAERIGERDE